jgi:superfamily I DNA/RNA helicase
VVAYEPTYLGGEEALVPVEAAAEAQERAVLQTPPIVGQAGQAITVDSPTSRTPEATHETVTGRPRARPAERHDRESSRSLAEGSAVEAFLARNPDAEGEQIADRIGALVRDGHELGEIAVLYSLIRTSARPLVQQLQSRNIPAVVVRLSGAIGVTRWTGTSCGTPRPSAWPSTHR